MLGVKLNQSLAAHRADGALVVVALALAVVSYQFGMKQFGGFDLSPMVDLGWRLWCGQRPYDDFILTFPPLFSLITELSFKVFGMQWRALVAINALLVFVATIAIYAIAVKLRMNRASAALLAVYVSTATLVLAGFWWHNTSAVVAACIHLLLVSWILETDAPHRRAWLYLIASLVVMATSKPNLGAPVIAFGAFILGWKKETRLHAVLAHLVAIAATLTLLTATGYPPQKIADAYNAVSARGWNFEPITSGEVIYDKYVLAALALLLAPFATIIVRRREQRRAVAGHICSVTFFCMALAAYAIATNMELMLVSLPLLAVGCSFLIRPETRSETRLFALTLGAAIALNLTLGMDRWRVETIGPENFWQPPEIYPLDEIETPVFFRGLAASPKLHGVLRELEAFRQQHYTPIMRVYFGPRIQFAYAALAIESPRGLPLWWHPGTSHGLAEQPEIIERWRQHDFDYLIHLRNDYTYYTAAQRQLIDSGYEKIGGYLHLTVHKKKALADGIEATRNTGSTDR